MSTLEIVLLSLLGTACVIWAIFQVYRIKHPKKKKNKKEYEDEE